MHRLTLWSSSSPVTDDCHYLCVCACMRVRVVLGTYSQIAFNIRGLADFQEPHLHSVCARVCARDTSHPPSSKRSNGSSQNAAGDDFSSSGLQDGEKESRKHRLHLRRRLPVWPSAAATRTKTVSLRSSLDTTETEGPGVSPKLWLPEDEGRNVCLCDDLTSCYSQT